MSRYRLTPTARQDLVDLQEYLWTQSIDATARVVGRIEAAMVDLASMPDMGHRRDDLTARNLRFWPVYSYLIVYRPDARPVEIVRIVHGARDVQSLLDE